MNAEPRIAVPTTRATPPTTYDAGQVGNREEQEEDAPEDEKRLERAWVESLEVGLRRVSAGIQGGR